VESSATRIYILTGLDCANCAAELERAVASLDGVKHAVLNFLGGRLKVTLSPAANSDLTWAAVEATVRSMEPAARLKLNEQPSDHGHESFSGIWMLIRLAVAVTALIWARFSDERLSLVLVLTAYAVSGADVVWRAIYNIARGKIFDEHFLMAIATCGAFIIGERDEAVAVMVFYQIGEYFQALAVHRSRRSIADLMGLQSSKALVRRGQDIVEIDCAAVVPGDILVIKNGDKVPVDSRVVSGYSTLDTSALTGESLPQEVGPSDTLFSGSINTGALLEAVATASYEDSTVAKILKLVQESGERKAASEQFITRFSRYYTPVVVFGAIALAFIPPVIFPNAELSVWVYRALVFLVVSCPCALVVSIPMGFFGGIGAAARTGVLVKGANHLSALANVTTLAFDKTGTLTAGSITVQEFTPAPDCPVDAESVVKYAAAAERVSSHPVAKAVVAFAPAGGARVEEALEVPGKGLTARVEEHQIAIGNLRLFQALSIGVPAVPPDLHVVWLALDGAYAGYFSLMDRIKGEAPSFIAALPAVGVTRTAIVSGDGESTVAYVAQQCAIDEWHGNLLPHEKVAVVERLIETERPRGKVGYVGDGINDAPVLARADIGISMGVLGSPAAIEASDVVVMSDNLERIRDAITIAKATEAVVRQNIVLALAVKAAVLILGAVGMASMWAAVFADTGVALLAVLNALRPLAAAGRRTKQSSCTLTQRSTFQ
jgi:Cd2+/Zn2+-exporting ATPase